MTLPLPSCNRRCPIPNTVTQHDSLLLEIPTLARKRGCLHYDLSSMWLHTPGSPHHHHDLAASSSRTSPRHLCHPNNVPPSGTAKPKTVGRAYRKEGPLYSIPLLLLLLRAVRSTKGCVGALPHSTGLYPKNCLGETSKSVYRLALTLVYHHSHGRK